MTDGMAASSSKPDSDAHRLTAVAAEPPRNPLRDRLAKAKRAAVCTAMGKSESWLDKVLNEGAGVMLEDIPLLLHAVDLKMVDVGKFCVDGRLARAYEEIAKHAMRSGSLFDEEAE